MDVLLDEEESGEVSRENRGRGRWEHCWRVRAVYVTCVTPSHIVTRSELVYVDVDVCSDYILYIYFRLRLLGHAMRLQPAFKKQPGGTFSPDNAPDRAPVVSVLLAPDQPIRQIVDMSASNAPRVFPSHGVTESITVALLGSELLLPLVSHKARPCIAEG
ncbi:hypothetical protein HID58_056722 [Brassica napus]|uniref:BnaC03g63060D protein n=2 Tax=Brassica napus TaxID=3708 RepID=A0A078F7A9_BRANA|nr:hypothetical protein HID58_056722 [Brassica napus]CAF1710729.1 unnamed protein product [Brassica napus]CDY09276.1 BnaC03g63060D [Brassica napus]